MSLPPAALFVLAQAGGGSGSYGGGGGGGGGGSGAGGSGGGDGDPLIGLIIIAIFVLIIVWGTYKAAKLRKKRRERVARTVTASAVAADDDPHFAAAAVERDAAALFTAIQVAWHERDRERLDQMVGGDLMVEWRRRLDDFERKGWHNQVAVKTGPTVEYIGMVNREDDTEDRVTVRLTAEMRSVVVDRNGKVLKKNDEASEMVSIAEYWTLLRRGDRWTLESIQQDSEGAHHLDAPLVPAPWEDDTALHDAAVVELAQADAAPAGTRFGELVDVDFADDARAAALDLSAVDERFAPHVLEVAARRALSAWAEAVDGDDAALLEVAEPAAVRELLYGGDATERTRVVVRGPRLEAVEIVGLDGDAEPPAFEVQARVTGRRYVENRDTLVVVSGSRDGETTFTERWRLELNGDAANPWRLAGATT